MLVAARLLTVSYTAGSVLAPNGVAASYASRTTPTGSRRTPARDRNPQVPDLTTRSNSCKPLRPRSHVTVYGRAVDTSQRWPLDIFTNKLARGMLRCQPPLLP